MQIKVKCGKLPRKLKKKYKKELKREILYRLVADVFINKIIKEAKEKGYIQSEF